MTRMTEKGDILSGQMSIFDYDPTINPYYRAYTKAKKPCEDCIFWNEKCWCREKCDSGSGQLPLDSGFRLAKKHYPANMEWQQACFLVWYEGIGKYEFERGRVKDLTFITPKENVKHPEEYGRHIEAWKYWEENDDVYTDTDDETEFVLAKEKKDE